MPVINLDRPLASWAEALDIKYRYIFIKGGRSSGKSHEVAGYLVERSICEKNLKIVCLREVQKSIDKSSKNLIDDKIRDLRVTSLYKSIQSEIRKLDESDTGLFYFQGMNDLTADNIKSLEGFKIAWFEEAQNCSAKSLKTLRPTIRESGSQIIFTWNPKFPSDPIDEFCAAMQGEPDCLIIHVNYLDNPFLSPEVLREVEIDKRNSSNDFAHIWHGEYDTNFHGHYYASLLDQAAAEGRISNVPRKSGVDIVTAWDLGRADSTCIWVAQIVGREVRIIDYKEGSFEDLEYYANWIKQNNYNGLIGLPHDAGHKRLGMKGSIADQLRTMGLINTKVLPAYSVDAGRALAKSLIKEAWFDKDRCADGIRALRYERAERDEKTGRWREIHEQDGAAAFRYLAHYLDKTLPQKSKTNRDPFAINYAKSVSYMGA